MTNFSNIYKDINVLEYIKN